MKENLGKLLRPSYETYDKRSTYDIPYWTPENPINDYAKLNPQLQADSVEG